MGNIKKYLAPTLREALEKIKEELGENTLVVEHKPIKTGGVFGFGAKEMVEVSVIVEANKNNNLLSIFKKTSNSKQPAKNQNIEDEPVRAITPSIKSAQEQSKDSASTRLAARAYALAYGHEEKKADFDNGIELSSEAPRVLHSVPKKKSTSVSSEIVSNSHSDNNSVNTLLVNELKRLQAEMREIKFSLATSNNVTDINKKLSVDDNEYPEHLCESPYYEAYMSLLGASVEPKLARRAIEASINIARHQGYIDGDRVKVAHLGLSQVLRETLHFADDILSLDPGTPGTPSAVVFVGPTGVGKTTTIAKLAAYASLHAKQRVELITLDTYRIAAVEQLKSYAEIIGAGFHVARTTVELSALKNRLAGKALVLIDTAGRSPNDLADQMEFANYLRNDCDLLKCLVLQATTHPLDAEVAIKKFGLYRPDQLVITKIDETTRPGAAIGIALDAQLPLAYLCNGQRVPDDFELASANSLASNVLRGALSVMAA